MGQSNNMQQRVGFGPRLVAFIIDSFFIAAIGSLLLAIFMDSTFQNLINGRLTEAILKAGIDLKNLESSEAYNDIIRLSNFVANFSLLYMFIEAFTGASPGKMLLSLKVGTENGKKGDTWLYFTRFAIKNSSSLLGLAGRTTGLVLFNTLGGFAGMIIFLGCFLVLGIKKQAVHDIVAKTAIFFKNDLK